MPVVDSSLWRPRSLSLADRENCAWSMWDRGTRRFGCGAHLLSQGVLNTTESIDHKMNSRPRKVSLADASTGAFVHRGDPCIWKVVTWLILPVVICLSQRLSHACLSINKFVLWNCEWLIKSVIVYLMVPCYMDNCGNSRANTCNQAPTSGRGVFIR